MRRLKAKSKSEKCRYKRCTYKRVDEQRYCPRHVELAPVFTKPVGTIPARNYDDNNPPSKSLLGYIKSFIFAEK